MKRSIIFILLLFTNAALAADPLPSWNDTAAKRAIRKSHIGKLDKAWDEATAKGWVVVDMKEDWKTIFPPATGDQ